MDKLLQTKPTDQEIENWGKSFDQSNVAVCLGKASGIVAIDLDWYGPRSSLNYRKLLPSPKVEK